MDPQLIEDCVHCGFCLPTCPTYALWGEEMDSPRGRIVLMDRANEEGVISPEMVMHWDRCLGCMACVTACPSGVQYDRLITGTRDEVERRYPRSRRERLLRRAAYALFTHPARVRALAALSPLARAPLPKRVRAALPLAATVHELAPRVPVRAAIDRLPAVTPARGEPRGRVALLQGCVQRGMFGGVNRATAEVLAAEGFEVHAPTAPRCCGALQYHEGDWAEGAALAQETIAAFDGFDQVVVNAAGCGSAMKEYDHLLADAPDPWPERARAFVARVRDVHELLADAGLRAPRRPLSVDGAPLRVAYHDACHLAHAQGVTAQPRAVLRAIPGVELLEPAEKELCCGSAGIYNLLQPEAARQLGDRKAGHLLDLQPDVIAAANPGCALQLQARLRARGREVPVLHPVELLHRALDS
jgi:glycolate oxidase iron-sulfur subunit